MRRVRARHAILIGLTLVGCRQESAGGDTADSLYVAVMSELQQVRIDPRLDSAGRAEARRKVLQGRGLTPEELARLARRVAEDPERAAEVWRAIEARSRVRESAPEPR